MSEPKPTPAGVAIKYMMKKGRGEIQGRVKEEIAKDAIGEAGSTTFKRAFGIATLFIEFVETYSKAVKQANLENVRQNLEVCPHIGGCANNAHAMSLVNNQEVTAWQAPDTYWYFHPQSDYLVRHAVQIYRSLPDGGWAIETPGRPRVQAVDCLGCCEAHGATAKTIPPSRY